MAFDIKIVEKAADFFVAKPRGEINTQTYQEFEQRLQDIVTKAKAIEFDMSDVSYVSSMGLSALFRIKLAVEEHGGMIAIVNMQPQVKQVFDTMKILSPQMFASLTEADEYLDKFLDGVQKGSIKPPDPFSK